MNQSAHQDVANTESKTDTELARRAGAGDRQAFAKLVDRYQTAVFRMVFYRTRSRPDAEDITQEVFMRAFDRLHGLREPGRFRSWLFAIAVNRTRDFHRKQRLRSLFGLTAGETPGGTDVHVSDSGPDPRERLIRKDFWNQVGNFLDQLPRMEREVFLLRFWDQFKLKEIAGVLGKSESTVKTHLYRALSKFKNSATINRLLRETINDHPGESPF